LGAYQPTKVPFLSEHNKIEFFEKNRQLTGKKLSLQMKAGFLQIIFIRDM
jgi:hypothetical protein